MVLSQPLENLHGIRTLSPVVSAIPWKTSIITDSGPLTTALRDLPCLDPLIVELDKRERKYSSVSSVSKEERELRGLLGVDFDFDAEPVVLVAKASPAPSEWTAARSVDVLTFLTPYRLLDSGLSCFGGVPASSLACQRGSHGDASALASISHIKDWASVLLRFRRVTLHLAQAPDLPRADNVPVSARIVDNLVTNTAGTDCLKIEHNLLLAALHLNCMLGSSSRPPAFDIPNDFDSFVSLVYGDASSGSAAAAKLQMVCDACRPSYLKTGDVSHVRTPLLYALWFSPLSLLACVHLSKQKFHKQRLLSACMYLGANYPPLLHQIVGILWNVLFCLGTGSIGPKEAIRDLLASLPWSEIESLDSGAYVRRWFDPASLPLIPPIQSTASPTQAQVSETPLCATSPSLIPSTASLPPAVISSTAPPSNAAGESQPCSPPASFETTTIPTALQPTRVSSPGPVATPEDPSPLLSNMYDGASSPPLSPASPIPLLDKPSVSSPQRNGPTSTTAAATSPVDPVIAPVVQDARSSARIRALKETPPLLPPPPPPPKPSNPKPRAKSSSKPSAPQKPSNVWPPPPSPNVASASTKGSRNDPIDVETFVANRGPVSSKQYSIKVEDEYLDAKISPRCRGDREYAAFDADGLRHAFVPSFHHPDYGTRISTLWERAELLYTGGRPPHISAAETSVVEIHAYSTFFSMSPGERLDRIACKNILLTGCPTSQCRFDEGGLSAIRPLHAKISIQDYSYPPTSKNLASVPHTVAGTPLQLLESVRQGTEGKILNALEFPNVVSIFERTSLESDVIAWQNSSGVLNSSSDSSYPHSHMNWFLAATSDTVTFIHIDTDGTNTAIRPRCGKKFWGLIRERPSFTFASSSALLHPGFQLDKVTKDSDFDIEIVVLRPSDMLLMQANTGHFVVGPDPTICEGFHFYSTSTMQRTIAGVVHCFVSGTFITNIYHHPTRVILRRMLVFYFSGIFDDSSILEDDVRAHIPDVSTPAGLLDLLAVCCFAILANVLDARSYCTPNQDENTPALPDQSQLLSEFDDSDITWDERMLSCQVRGIAISVFRLVRAHSKFLTPSGSEISDLPYRLLSHLMRTLLSYKKAAVRHHVEGVPHCTVAMLKRQIDDVAAWDSDVGTSYKSGLDDNLTGIGMREHDIFLSPPQGCAVQWSAPPSSVLKGMHLDYFTLGTTELDYKYFNSDSLRKAGKE